MAACAPQPEPRTALDFMDDGLAREGVLARCNEHREETLTDQECANARRAAATLALEAERARAPQLEQESEAKLLAMRNREGRQAAEQDAAAPAFGAPLGTVMPSMTGASFDVYAEGADPLGRRTLEVAAAEPPSNEVVIPAPRSPDRALVAPE